MFGQVCECVSECLSLCVCVCVFGLCVCHCRCLERLEMLGLPGSGVIGGCELITMDAGNQA